MTKLVGPRGPDSARIMVVGEAPGAEEERLGQPFVGPSGNLLTEMLNQAGINPAEVYYTNLCQVRPPGNKLYRFFSKEGIPNATVLQGLAQLQAQIDRVKPNIILPLGGFPLKFLTGKGKWKKITKKESGAGSSKEDEYGFVGITDYRGYLLPGTPFARGIKCIPTFHPAAVLRNYPHKHIVRADFQRALSEAGDASIRYPRKYICIDPQGPDRDAWRAWLTSEPGTESPVFRFPPTDDDPVPGPQTVRSGGFLTADIEYIGSRLLCLGATRHADVAIVFKTPDAASIEFIRGILLSGVPLCFQNGMFDCSILEWFYGIECVKHMLHDTMIAMHAAYTEWPKDLGFIGSLGKTQYPWWDGIDSEYWKGVKKGTRSPDECLIYNGGDVWNTHDAMESLLRDELQDPQIMATYRHEMDTVLPLWEMSKFGVRIDTKKLETLKTTLETEVTTLNAGLAKIAGKPVNAKSGPDVNALMYDTLKLPHVGHQTATGAWATGDWVMAKLLDAATNDIQRAAVKMVRAVRERRDLISKFCEIELDTDGRMRCHYDPAKTVTGRLSSRKFYPTGLGTNLQNVPKDGRVRAVFVPDSGCVFGYADLKSAESLVVAHITGDPEMLRLHSAEYMSGEKDGHKYVAAYLLNKRIEDVNKDERYLGKRIRHGSNYGLGWKKLMDMVNADAQTTGVSITAAEAKVLINKYRDLHHELPKWWNDVLQQLWSTHTITSCLGRKRVFYDRPDATLQEAIAYNPQSTIAQTLNLGLLNLARSEALRRLGFRLLLQVHDAVGFQVPIENLPQAIPLIREAMRIEVPIVRRGTDPYYITIPVDIQIGENWGEADEDKPLPDGSIKKAVNPNGLRVYKEAA